MDLHLIVIAAKELEVAVCPLAYQITTAVQAVACYERAVDKTFGIGLRQVQIATRHPGTADMQLADNPLRYGLVISVEHIQPCVADRTPDRQGSVRHGLVGLQRPDTAIDCGFGRAIHVVQAHLRQTFAQLRRHLHGQLTAPADNVGQAAARAALRQIEELL